MLAPDDSRRALERFFANHPVAELAELGRTLGTASRMSVFRRLSDLDYLSSYSHNGRYYTLRSVPEFDTDGLWRYQGIGFSLDGTLKATVQRIVGASEAGRTQRELALRLGVRVHNPLLDLVEGEQLRRELIDDEYLYLAGKRARANAQIKRHAGLKATPSLVAAIARGRGVARGHPRGTAARAGRGAARGTARRARYPRKRRGGGGTA